MNYLYPNVHKSTKQIHVIFFCWMLMALPLLIDGRIKEFLIWVSISSVVYILIIFMATKCSFLLFDRRRNLVISCRLCIKKKINIKDITNIKTRLIFGGMLTEMCILYTSNNKRKIARTLTVEMFDKNELITFLKSLKNDRPFITIDPKLLD
jgi:hypothetical protein